MKRREYGWLTAVTILVLFPWSKTFGLHYTYINQVVLNFIIERSSSDLHLLQPNTTVFTKYHNAFAPRILTEALSYFIIQ